MTEKSCSPLHSPLSQLKSPSSNSFHAVTNYSHSDVGGVEMAPSSQIYASLNTKTPPPSVEAPSMSRFEALPSPKKSVAAIEGSAHTLVKEKEMSFISNPPKIAWNPATPGSNWKMAPPGSESMTVPGSGNLPTELHSLAQWPSLAISNISRSKRSQAQDGVIESGIENRHLTKKVSYMAATMGAQHGNSTIPLKAQEDENRRFPWAARMNPSMRNLYRATSPTYMEDGTPKVSIPSHVLLKGLENQQEFILGHFYRCSTPSGGLIHAVVNRIWGRKCRIFIRRLGESSYLFHIPDESTRSWVLQRGLWHVDECLMFVAPWSPTSTLSVPEISTVPVWVTLKNIPNQLYSISGISHIASGLGAPMATFKPRLDPTLMGEAKIMVEIELDKPFPQKIAAADSTGSISMVDVVYSWIPTKCGRCGHLGHKESRCLQHLPIPQANSTIENFHPPVEVHHSETPSKAKVVTETACLSISEITHMLDSNIDDVLKGVSVPLIEDISISNVVEVPLQESEPVSFVEMTPLGFVFSDTNVATTTDLVVASIPATVPTTQEIIMKTSSPTLDAHVIQVSSNLPPLDVQNSETLMLDAHVPSNIPELPSLDDTDLQEDGGLSTPEASDTDVDFMTSSSQRILRDRPVQPTLKYNEDEWISVSSCRRSKRNRGSRRERFS